ncbi:unnamed protein product [Linum trigynum]|uniref:Uncharacterized protein n=1 Tax=Linum trigynum TaxID=586398 RepID=A0AAV2GET5_9ROSI
MEEHYSPAAAATTITESDIQAAEQLMELSNSDGGTASVFPRDESNSAGSVVNLAGNVDKRNKTAAKEEEEMVSGLRWKKKKRKWRSLESIYSSTVPIKLTISLS